MNNHTRRGFLAVAGAGAAAAGAATIAPSVVSASPVSKKLPAGAQGHLVAYIEDVQKGTVTLMVGEREVTVTDADLVARLAHAASKAT